MYEYPTVDIDVYDKSDLGLLGVIISVFTYLLGCESIDGLFWYWVSDVDYFRSHVIPECPTSYLWFDICWFKLIEDNQ